MNKNFKLFGIFNIIDITLLAILAIAVCAILLVSSGIFKATPKVAKETKNIEIDVMLRAKKVSRNGDVFKVGDKTFMTIRNVPHTKLNIVKCSVSSEKVAIPDPRNKKRAVAVDNPAFPNTYNYVVTVTDKAIVTDDGYVVGGNKIKIGLPIILEGFDYKMSGLVSDVRTANNKK